MTIPATELGARLQGLLAFPVTPFTSDNAVNTPLLRRQVERLLGAGVAGLYPACGTGEFFSLSPDEYREVVGACVEQVAGRVPVVAGVGYGAALAGVYIRAAEEAGADGLLVFPPYLTHGGAAGLEEHYRAVARSTRLGVILYQRDQVLFEAETVARLAEEPNVIGLKDGIGQVERLLDIRRVVGDRLVLLNGLPTAEIHAAALSFCGARGYSSAILNFIPEIAMAFHRAMQADDTATMHRLLDTAILPLAEIRRRRAGYAIALVKAGARLRGVPVGPVRPPLCALAAEDEQDLRRLLSSLGLGARLSMEEETAAR